MTFQSVFGERLLAYVELRRALGHRFDQLYHLRAFDRFVFEKGYTELTQALALEFASYHPDSSSSYRAERYKVVRQLSDYLALWDPQTPCSTQRLCRSPKLERNPTFTRTKSSNASSAKHGISHRATRCVD